MNAQEARTLTKVALEALTDRIDAGIKEAAMDGLFSSEIYFKDKKGYPMSLEPDEYDHIVKHYVQDGYSVGEQEPKKDGKFSKIILSWKEEIPVITSQLIEDKCVD